MTLLEQIKSLLWYIEVSELWRSYPRSWDSGGNKNFSRRMYYGFIELNAIYKKAELEYDDIMQQMGWYMRKTTGQFNPSFVENLIKENMGD